MSRIALPGADFHVQFCCCNDNLVPIHHLRHDFERLPQPLAIHVEVPVHSKDTTFIQRLSGCDDRSVCEIHWRVTVVAHEHSHPLPLAVRRCMQPNQSIGNVVPQCLLRSPASPTPKLMHRFDKTRISGEQARDCECVQRGDTVIVMKTGTVRERHQRPRVAKHQRCPVPCFSTIPSRNRSLCRSARSFRPLRTSPIRPASRSASIPGGALSSSGCAFEVGRLAPIHSAGVVPDEVAASSRAA